MTNFWRIGNGKHMPLFLSHKQAAQYYIGDCDQSTHRLIPNYHGRMSYGPLAAGSLHAPSATIDDRGRLLAICSVKDGLPQEGWSNVMTLLRHLWLDADNALRIEPVDEVESLRAAHDPGAAADSWRGLLASEGALANVRRWLTEVRGAVDGYRFHASRLQSLIAVEIPRARILLHE